MRAILVALGLILSASAAHAQYEVFDPTHTAETAKVLQEQQRHFKVLTDTYTTAQSIMSRLGGLNTGGLGQNLSGIALSSATQCLVPNANRLRLPGGTDYSFSSACDAAEWMKKKLDYDPANPDDEFKNRPPGETQRKIQERRTIMHKDSVFEGMSVAKSMQQSLNSTTNAANQLINAANQAQTVVDVGRVQVQAQAAVLVELAHMRVLMAQLLQVQASFYSTQMPTVSTFASSQ